MNAPSKALSGKLPLVIAIAVIVVLGAGFAAYYSGASSQISSLQSKNASLQNQLNSTQGSVATLQSEQTSSQSQISSLQSQLSGLESQLGNAQTQIQSLNSSVSMMKQTIQEQQALLNLQVFTTEASMLTVNEQSNAEVSVVNFTASYAGYVEISGTTTTSSGYIRVTESTGFDQTFTIGSGGEIYVYIIPGTVSVYFGNHDFGVGATATLSVVCVS